MDIDLPGANGIMTTQALLKKYPTLNIPIIACTSHSAADIKAKCLAAGMVDHLQKPVSSSLFAQCLECHLTERVFHG